MRRRWAAALLVVVGVTAPAHAHESGGTYRWVGDDDAPAGRRAELSGAVMSVWTPDLQAALTLPSADGAFVELEPAATRDLPDGVHADGNAYEVTGGDGGALTLAVPHEATGALRSVDGETWTAVPFEPGVDQIVVDVRGDGLYLAVTDHDVRASSGGTPVAVVVGPPLLLLALVAAKRRRREPVTT